MPPSAVKTIRDLIFWQYAKLISKSAKLGINARAFQMKKFIELRDEKIEWSTTIREYVREHENPDICAYCGVKDKLTLEHILPRSRGGPNIPDNAVLVCQGCNSSKGAKRLYEWHGIDNKDEIPRIVEGKYLKLLYGLHEKAWTLNEKLLCDRCDMGELCKEAGKVKELNVYCLEGLFKSN